LNIAFEIQDFEDGGQCVQERHSFSQSGIE